MVCCEKENNDNYNKLNHYKVKDISRNVLISKTNFESFIKKLNENKNLKSKTNDIENIYDFYIDYGTIREIELDQNISYTFKIQRNNFSVKYFENLVVIAANGEITNAYLLKYTPSESTEYISDHKTSTFQGNVNITNLNLENLNLQQKSTCRGVWVAYCSWSYPHDRSRLFLLE